MGPGEDDAKAEDDKQREVQEKPSAQASAAFSEVAGKDRQGVTEHLEDRRREGHAFTSDGPDKGIVTDKGDSKAYRQQVGHDGHLASLECREVRVLPTLSIDRCDPLKARRTLMAAAQ